MIVETDLDHRAGMQAARTGGDVVPLLVAAAGGVVVPQPTGLATQVVASEDRYHDHALHRRGRLPRTIVDSWFALPSRLSDVAFDLLVVLELELEQPDHLHRRACGAGDGHAAVPVGLDDLLHRAMRDQVARRRPPVARHHDAVVVRQRNAGRGVRHRQCVSGADAAATVGARPMRRSSSGKLDPGSSPERRTASSRITDRPFARTTSRSPRRWSRALRRSRRADRRVRP